MLNASNNALSTLASGISSGALSLTVASGDGTKFPAPPFRLTIFLAGLPKEIVEVTAKTGDVFTISRAKEAVGGVQTAFAHLTGAIVVNTTTAGYLEELHSLIAYPHRLIFESDFNKGMEGWVGLKTGSLALTTPDNLYRWPTLTTETSAFGGKCLKLDLGQGITITGTLPNTAGWAIKRASLERGLYRWSGWIAWNGENQNWLRFLKFAVDTQDPNFPCGSKAFWFEVRYENFAEAATPTPDVQGNWMVETGTRTSSVMTTFQSSPGHILPYNEWQKINWHRFALTLDTELMRYVSFQIDDKFWNLGAYAPTPGTPYADDIFDHGFNCMLGATNRSNNSSAHSWVYMSKPKLERLFVSEI